jgi:hypothetical protein
MTWGRIYKTFLRRKFFLTENFSLNYRLKKKVKQSCYSSIKLLEMFLRFFLSFFPRKKLRRNGILENNALGFLLGNVLIFRTAKPLS